MMSRDYRGDLKWLEGLIVNKIGPLMQGLFGVDISTS